MLHLIRKENKTDETEKIEDGKKKILAVDDEDSIIDLLKFNIEKEGYNFISASDGEEALRKVEEENPDLVILDVMLPKMDGLAVCRKIRQTDNQVPIIMLSARGEEIDKILGLEIGADDYMTKPFSTRELIARIKANLRKAENDAFILNSKRENKIVLKNITLNLDKFEAVVDGKLIDDLTRREFEVLKFLAEKPGQVVTREDLLEKVWGYEYYGDIRTVDVTVRRIREKIEKNTANPKILITKRGVGYFIANEK